MAGKVSTWQKLVKLHMIQTFCCTVVVVVAVALQSVSGMLNTGQSPHVSSGSMQSGLQQGM